MPPRRWSFCAAATCAAFCCAPASSFRTSSRLALYFVWHRHLIGGAQQSMDVTAVVEKLRAFDLRHYLQSTVVVSAGDRACASCRRACSSAYCGWRKKAGGAERDRHRDPPIVDRRVDRIARLSSVLALAGHRKSLCDAAVSAGRIPDRARAVAARRCMRMRIVVNCLFATIAFKYVAALWIYPAYLREYRGDYAARGGRSRATDQGLCALRDRCFGDGLERRRDHRCTSIPAATVAVAAGEVERRDSCCRTSKIRRSATSFANSRSAATDALPLVPRRGVRATRGAVTANIAQAT